MLRAVARDGGIYTVANFLTKSFSFLLVPFYTRFFLQSDIGIMDVLSVFGLLITSVVCLQLNQGMGRYVADPEVNERDRIKYGSSAILFTILMYIIFCSLIIIISPFFIKVLSSDDLRAQLSAASLGQASVKNAPMSIIICGVPERITKKYKERGIRYMYIEAGHIAQNIHLEAVALGLGSVPIGAFDDNKVRSVLKLPEDQSPLYIVPVGYIDESLIPSRSD